MKPTVLSLHSIPPPGELPPPPPRACFGRDELIEKIVNLAENLTPIALIGPGGIGKTSIALTVLGHDRIKAQFGDNCRFIRCDEFPPSHTHFLSRLSKVIGAGVENPEGLAPLRPFLSSRKMILVLDNAESILDPQGTNAREIYSVVEELSQVGNICLCLTSRISTIPPTCKTFDVPTLSVGAARDTFYRIYKNGGQSDVIDRVLQQLDLHPLSITLLATVAHQSKWDANQLRREWRKRRRDMLQTHHNTSLAITIELSLTSPMFQALGPDARELLGVVAFLPQGVNENNLNWLFPVLLNRTNILDNFCVLSLTHRSNKFITMLAPLRDYLYPKDPTSSRLLCATRDHYFHLLSVNIDPRKPGYEKARWIKSEDVNVEHLLDVFTSINKNSVDTWDACYNFMKHLYWRKPRLVTLAPKIEGLPDSHPSKPRCLRQLSLLFDALGNRMESKRLLIHTLKLWKERGNNREVAKTLRAISEANRHLGLKKEGVEQVKEALEVNKRLGDVIGQGKALRRLSWLLHDDGQLDAAEEAASKAIKLFLDKGDQLQVCACHRVLGSICRSRGEIKKAINHYEATLRIASSFSLHGHIFWAHYSLADLFFDENRSDKAHRHIEYAKSHTADSPYRLGRATELQARFWYKRRMLKEAKSEALVAADIFEKTGAAKDLKDCRALLRKIEETASRKLGSNGAGEFLELNYATSCAR